MTKWKCSKGLSSCVAYKFAFNNSCDRHDQEYIYILYMPVTYIRKKLVYPILSIWSIEVCLLALFKLDKPRSERIQLIWLASIVVAPFPSWGISNGQAIPLTCRGTRQAVAPRAPTCCWVHRWLQLATGNRELGTFCRPLLSAFDVCLTHANTLAALWHAPVSLQSAPPAPSPFLATQLVSHCWPRLTDNLKCFGQTLFWPRGN